MTKEQIYASLDAMLANPKAKTFLNHLVRAYMPTNITKVLERPKGFFKSVLTNVELISSQELTKALESTVFQMEMKESIAVSLDAKTSEALTKIIGSKQLGVTGNETTTFMTNSAYEAFSEWVITKSLKGDKHINWLLGSIRRETLMARAENIKDTDVQNKVAAFKKHNAVVKGTTISLGETSDVLMKLKAAMEANNN